MELSKIIDGMLLLIDGILTIGKFHIYIYITIYIYIYIFIYMFQIYLYIYIHIYIYIYVYIYIKHIYIWIWNKIWKISVLIKVAQLCLQEQEILA